MTGFENLCVNCMSDTAGREECPVCGFPQNKPQMQHALPYKTMLQNRYIVGRAQKSNGEGVTYIGFDTVLNVPVQVREFFPQTLSERSANGKDVRVISGSEIIFDECLASFLGYARSVAHLRDLSAVVQIYDIFEENHTAYAISEWEDLITLRYFVERSGGSLGWNAARQLFMPVLSALSTMHTSKINHLGISPDTLFITKDGKMKLGDFCIPTVRQMDTDLPPDLVPGCAAIEQYVMDYAPDETTDVYGFAASLFFTLTGMLPKDALKRRTDSRLFIPTALVRSIPPYVISALANALQVSPDKRTPDFERLRAELSAAPTVTATIEQTKVLDSVTPSTYVPPEPEPEPEKKGLPGFVWAIITCIIALAICTVVALIWLNHSGTEKPVSSSTESSEVSSEESEISGVVSDDASSETGDQIPVPNLVGENYEELTKKLESSNAEITTPEYQVLLSKKEFSDTITEGCIVSQSPEAGTMMAKGTAIVVVVSQGPQLRTLPAIAGKSLADASTAVAAAGLTPTKTEAYSSTVASGQVIGYQDAKEGSQLPYGSQVVIVVSKGPDPAASSAE